MTKRNCVICLTLFILAAGAMAEEHDYYKNLRHPAKLVPGVGLDKIAQEGGAGYKRRTVQWWPRKGQDFVDIPEGAPLRTWTRNKGQKDTEALAGAARNWTASDPETFKAHLIAFRGFGTSSADTPRIPAAVLRLENGRQRAVIDFAPVSRMISRKDRDFIHKVWEEVYPKLYAKISKEERPVGTDLPLKHWKALPVRFNAMEPWKDANAKYPLWGEKNGRIIFETRNFHLTAATKGGGRPPAWVRPNDIEGQNRFRRDIFEYIENFWTYVEAAGHSMPFWHRPGPNKKYTIIVTPGGSGVGDYHCGIGNANTAALAHEFFHSQPLGGWRSFHYIMGNAGQHTGHPGELQMFTGNFRYPWRYINRMGYQSPMMFFVLGDNPNWGYGIQVVIGGLAAAVEPTPYHTIAMAGQKKGLWKNGVRGFGDFLGEYAARMATIDLIEQFMIRCKYGMPETSYLYPVYGHENRYRISNAEAPRWTGYNIIRLDVDEGAKEIGVDFQGIHDPLLHSDWRACIVAADGEGWARYSPLWNKGKMTFALKPTDKRLWLTVSASPSAFPVQEPHDPGAGWMNTYLSGIHAPRYPWEVALTGCKPGTPHRKHGDIIDFEELYPKIDCGNTYLNWPVKHEVPIPLTEKDGELSQKKLAAMAPRIEASSKALQENIKARKSGGYYANKKGMALEALRRRVKFLQRNAKGHRHENGGGFVSENAKVSASAYVGPDAMVLDGARVKDNACIKEFAVVFGPKTVVSGNAKISGRAWVTGDLEVSGDARILEAATVTTSWHETWGRGKLHEGQARITGTAVVKGELFLLLCFATDQTLTGGLVMDYVADVRNTSSGVFEHGRFYRAHDRYDRAPGFGGGTDAGAPYANWQFNHAKTVLLEDSYVNNNGILHGRPGFVDENEGLRKSIVFNGRNQYAEAPPSVADFGQLTIDIMVNRSGGKGGRLFDFGTSDEECFYLSLDGGGKPTLTARHKGKTCTVVAGQGIPVNKWARVRLEMDGRAASIYLDGKQVAKKGFAFSPRSVFIGDRPEGNFIACGRNKDEFFAGKMDHFRIYRKVHKDFDAIGPPPSALVMMSEWSEKTQQRHDEWQERRKAKDAELRTGKYGQMQKEIAQLRREKAPGARIEALRKQAETLRENALKSAGLSGRNPYLGTNAAKLYEFQKSLKYHTTADWDHRTKSQKEGKIPDKTRKWLKRVRGY
ncbi:MAG: hypothetical protein ISS69_08260 [Phycisphaerae bacterium]|nr:hypothetical protein [Phycisphaerae bacterium]